jgi:hypothetical protein
MFFRKKLNVKFHEKPTIWGLSCSTQNDRETDGYDGINS